MGIAVKGARSKGTKDKSDAYKQTASEESAAQRETSGQGEALGDATDTKEKILRAATALFSLANYEAVSIKSISSAAGVNSAAISYYFGGKQPLYEMVLESQADRILAVFTGEQADALSPLKRIVYFMDTLSKNYLADERGIIAVFREFMSPTRAGENIINGKIRTIFLTLMNTFDEARESGLIWQHVNGHHAAFTLISIFFLFLIVHPYGMEVDDGMILGGSDFDELKSVYMSYLKDLCTGSGMEGIK